MTGATCATTTSTEYMTGATSGPIGEIYARTAAMSARTFETETTKRRAANAVTFVRTSVICAKIGVTCARTVGTSGTTAVTCAMISENKTVGSGEEKQRWRRLLPLFFAITQPTDSSIHFRYSALPSSIETTTHSGKS